MNGYTLYRLESGFSYRFEIINLYRMPGHFDPVHQASDYLGPGFYIIGGSQASRKGGGRGKKVTHLARKNV